MTRKTNYQEERERQTKKNNIGMSKLTEKQLQSIKKTHETLSTTLDMLRECQDMYLSDIRQVVGLINILDKCYWQLNNNFNLDN